MIKNILILLIFMGIILMTIALTKESNVCQEPKIVYRYIPRTFEEEQLEPVYESDIFKTMFTQESPWVTSVNEYDYKQYDKINKYFISQV